MALFDDLQPQMKLRGLRAGLAVTLLGVTRYGADSAELVYEEPSGRVDRQLIFRGDAAGLELVPEGPGWLFQADGQGFRLVSEAYRIHLAYLFDPVLAVHASRVDPLPHQITAVYETMLTRQPLRYLLADDPGAGKTIMTGLLIKELMLRGDVKRCLIVAPGNLVEQWQDELARRFQLSFEILTNDRLEASLSGNVLHELPLCIARLDKLSRNEEVQQQLRLTEWDLVVVDEAHKMSATFFNSEEIKYTKRYRLGELLGEVTRHLLLLTATPHNGKEEDFQIFLRLLDPDRFAGRFRSGTHRVQVSDIMRHLVKEQLYRFDGTLLFPERYARTLFYELSPLEQTLYERVTAYVREEFNRADALENQGRRGTVGFALTILQRRLASSPEAIYQSLHRRRERPERRLRELSEQATRAANDVDELANLHLFDAEAQEELDDAPGEELEAQEEELVDQASAARTMAELELELEIDHLRDLETLAMRVRASGQDRKWDELRRLLQDGDPAAAFFTTEGQREKLVIFTEHRDTLSYLAERIRTLLGREESVVTIHGAMRRNERASAQEAFVSDPATQVLIATDAAGEGINLQRAHLMVNYDLPWNPNRLEQRFGRIHRIGQREVCFLWNLVAQDTREGEVFAALFRKLETEREALGGSVFDVLGKVTFDNRPLRELIVEAIREGQRPEVRARLLRVVEQAVDRKHLRKLLNERALSRDDLGLEKVQQVREAMERAQARRLQPHFIAAFFLQAFQALGGRIYPREKGRYELLHVPAPLRRVAERLNPRAPLARNYERVTFEKIEELPGQTPATFIAPGHPLLDAVITATLEQKRELLTQGAVLVDELESSQEPRLLFYLEHTIQDGRERSNGQRQEVSRQLHFVELPVNSGGQASPRAPRYAPYLDYRPLHDDEQALLPELLARLQLPTRPEEQARAFAIAELVPQHLMLTRRQRDAQIRQVRAAVQERLSKEIIHWSNRALELREKERRSGHNARLNSQKAQERADEFQARLDARLLELDQEAMLSSQPPTVIGGALIIPASLLQPAGAADDQLFAHHTRLVEQLAMQATMRAELNLGHDPRDVSALKMGYDIESRDPGSGQVRYIEVKGRHQDATTVTITRNEILVGLNEQSTGETGTYTYLLAIARVDLVSQQVVALRYIRHPYASTLDFSAISVNYDLRQLWAKGEDML